MAARTEQYKRRSTNRFSRTTYILDRLAYSLNQPVLIPAIDPRDDVANFLKTTGRWQKILHPIAQPQTFFSIQNIYGVAGASGGGADFQQNGDILAAASSRILQYSDIPSIICIDANVNIEDSFVLRTMRDQGHLVDLLAERNEDGPTYCKEGSLS